MDELSMKKLPLQPDHNLLRPMVGSELKSIFSHILTTLCANTKTGRGELGREVSKILLAKIKDEKNSPDRGRPPRFRVESGEDSRMAKRRISSLFEEVKDDLREQEVFSRHEQISLDPDSVTHIIRQLEHVSLLQTNSDVMGDAFEVFLDPRASKEKGQFFTPRNVVKVAVKLANPLPGTTLCDPACGAGGFLTCAMQYMQNSPRFNRDKRYRAQKTLFGIEKDAGLVKICKAHIAVLGNEKAHIVHDDTLKSAWASGVRFDTILTNPPFGVKTKVMERDSACFDLGHIWKKAENGVWRKTGKACKRNPYVLFIEKCLKMLKPSGTLGMVLPESVFHAPAFGYIRQYLLGNNNLTAVIDLPHNTFRPHCNAKTCLFVLRKHEKQGNSVIMATPQETGYDHRGKPLYKPGSDNVQDDLQTVLTELDHIDQSDNRHVFRAPWSRIDTEVLAPRFYRGVLNVPPMPSGFHGVRLGDLEKDGTLEAWDGHGSPPGESKGRGSIPYIRVKDIVNWEMYRNPVSLIPRDVYLKIKGAGVTLQACDVIFVRRGSYRIGTVAMASPRDSELLLTQELLVMRIRKPNPYGISPHYLLAALSSSVVQQQIPNYVLVDTTLPNIGDRWKRLIIPVPDDPNEQMRISCEVEQSIRDKWAAQDRINTLRKSFGNMVT